MADAAVLAEITRQLAASIEPAAGQTWRRRAGQAKDRQALLVGDVKANLPGMQDVDYVQRDGVVLGTGLLFASGSARLTDKG